MHAFITFSSSACTSKADPIEGRGDEGYPGLLFEHTAEGTFLDSASAVLASPDPY